MICRHWRGWTTPENAAPYQTLLTNTIMPDIFARGIDGLVSYQAMHRDITNPDGSAETEHTTLMWFTSIDAIKNFVGEDYEVANMPEAAKAVLSRWDARVLHYDVFDEIETQRVNGTGART
ncbi:MAG: antibiotic biosynthesis monooxygenase [Hyphomonadaceae bacterium]